MGREDATLISREPWYSHPPASGQSLEDMDWGFLLTYSNGDMNFITEPRPTLDEILASDIYKTVVKKHVE
jgi:hypothetical protein